MKLSIVTLYVVLVATGSLLYNVNAVSIKPGQFSCSGAPGVCGGHKATSEGSGFQLHPLQGTPVSTPAPLSKLLVRTSN